MKRKFFSLIAALIFTGMAYAQPAGRLFVLNEGAFGGALGSFGYVDFQAGTYTHLDSVAQYGNQVLLQDGRLYVLDGNGSVLIFDAGDDFSPLDTLANIGARHVQVYGDQLLVSGTREPFFRSYDIAAGYAFRYGLDSTQIGTAREEFVIVGNKAYVTGFFNDTLLAVVDLVAEDTLTFIPTSLNNYQIEVIGNSVFVASYAFTPSFDTDATIHEIDPVADTVIRTAFLPNAGDLTASATHLYLKSPQGEVFRYDPVSKAIDTTAFGQAFYGFTYHAATDVLFVSRTNFFSTGEVAFIAGDSLSAFLPTHISPRSFYFESMSTPVAAALPAMQAFRLFPNPASGRFFIDSDRIDLREVRLIDMQGRQVGIWEMPAAQEASFSLEGIAPGVYVVQLIGKTGIASRKLRVE